jgi:MoxR-like ATPase
MQERQVTIEGTTHLLERPFLVLATQNPIEYEGTYPLPEAQLDRFLLRLQVGYPEREDEWRILEQRLERTSVCRSARARAERWRCSSSPGAALHSQAATSRLLTTSSRLPSRRWPTASH